MNHKSLNYIYNYKLYKKIIIYYKMKKKLKKLRINLLLKKN